MGVRVRSSAIGCAALGIVLDLPEEDRREIDGEMDLGMALQDGGHRIVVTDRMQSDPRERVGALLLLGLQIFVERLVLVPEDCQVDLGSYQEGEVAPRGCARW